MSNKDIIIPFSDIDMNRVVVDRDGINAVNLQRFEMQQLDAIVYEDLDRLICVGYKDATPNEFWVRGHMPGMPLMPGVVMCEAAAQLASYFATRHNLLGADAIGLGGLEGIRFRNVVLPGKRLVLMSEMTKVRRGALIVCRFQGYVDEQIVVEGEIKGVPLPKAALPPS